jgi:hypothetical protein
MWLMVTSDATRAAVERWFLREGAPWVVRGPGPHPVLARMLPYSVVVGAFSLPFTVLGAVLLDPADPDNLSVDDALRLLGVVFGAVATALVAVAVFLYLRTRHPVLRGGLAGLVGFVAALLIDTVTNLVVHGVGDALDELPQTLLAFVVAYLVVWSGLGALVAWGLRRVVGRAGSLLSVVSRAIPPLLLLVAFLFINAEAWQLSANLDRHRLWGVVVFLVVMILLFLVFRLPREVTQLAVEADRAEIVAACRRSPMAFWAEELPTGPAEPLPLRRSERLNVVGLLFVAQIIQVAVLAVAVFVLFWVFGAIAVTDTTITQWIGHPPTPGTLFGLPVPVSTELVQVCILVAALSALYFAIYTLTDSVYRAEFLDDELREIKELLLARECYLRTVQ